MPTITAFFDALAEAFGREEVEDWQRQSMQDGRFFATENGFTIGKRPDPPSPEKVRTADQELATSARCKRDPRLRPYEPKEDQGAK